MTKVLTKRQLTTSLVLNNLALYIIIKLCNTSISFHKKHGLRFAHNKC